MNESEGHNILIIDDDESLQRAWGKFLKKYNVVHAYSREEGVAAFKKEKPDMVLLDVVLPDGSGLDLLPVFKQIDVDIPIVVVTGQFDMHIAAQAVKAGAWDFLAKPVNTERLKVTVSKSLQALFLAKEVNRLRMESTIAEVLGDGSFIVKSKALKQAVSRLQAVAPRNTTVSLLGPSGVGKSAMARILHKISKRKDKNFVEINITSMNEGTLESQLFGHLKGAFTGAVKDVKGVFAMANGGTIFLDEIGDIPLSIQVKLLQVIEDGVYYPVGSDEPIEVDVRIVTATVHDMRQLVLDGRFRKDLFYRLNVFPITVPPLIERKEEIPTLINHFIHKICAKEEIPEKTVSMEFLQKLLHYDWPGNIRELENAVEYAITVAKDRIQLIESDLLGYHSFFDSDQDINFQNPEKSNYFDSIPEISKGFNLDAHLNELTKKIISFTLAKENANLTKTAKILGLTRRRLSLLISKLNIETKTSKGRPKKQ